MPAAANLRGTPLVTPSPGAPVRSYGASVNDGDSIIITFRFSPPPSEAMTFNWPGLAPPTDSLTPPFAITTGVIEAGLPMVAEGIAPGPAHTTGTATIEIFNSVTSTVVATNTATILGGNTGGDIGCVAFGTISLSTDAYKVRLTNNTGVTLHLIEEPVTWCHFRIETDEGPDGPVIPDPIDLCDELFSDGEEEIFAPGPFVDETKAINRWISSTQFAETALVPTGHPWHQSSAADGTIYVTESDYYPGNFLETGSPVGTNGAASRNYVEKFTPDGMGGYTSAGEFGPDPTTVLDVWPGFEMAIRVDASGNVWLLAYRRADNKLCLFKIDSSGTLLRTWTNLDASAGPGVRLCMDIDSANRVYYTNGAVDAIALLVYDTATSRMLTNILTIPSPENIACDFRLTLGSRKGVIVSYRIPAGGGFPDRFYLDVYDFDAVRVGRWLIDNPYSLDPGLCYGHRSDLVWVGQGQLVTGFPDTHIALWDINNGTKVATVDAGLGRNSIASCTNEVGDGLNIPTALARGRNQIAWIGV